MSLVSFDLSFSSVLFDTLIWTAALIALVLVLRRPVTRWLGAPAAYALWLLPMLRLILPPIKLPAWAAPVKEAAPETVPEIASLASEPVAIALTEPAPAIADAAALVVDGPAQGESATSLWTTMAALPLTEIALAVWLTGAGVFLYLRFSAYFRLRAELTQDAIEVGTTKGPFGTIRLIETPGTNAPLAFGVLDPVIALPPGFMASPNEEARAARDLALAHELEHHRGHDLLINVLAQPLFALHWFNPLGRYGWLALRRDQEAACDARVMACAPKEARALYAEVIASFAAGPNVAPQRSLAAPMACPVLGDKSIIHRLRNLKMNDDASHTKSRKWASRAMLGAAVLALPLTASVTYAERLVPGAPKAPKLGLAEPMPAVAPRAPLITGLAQAAPAAPEAPEAPAKLKLKSKSDVTIITVDPDTGETEKLELKGDKDKLKTMKFKDKKVMVLRSDDSESVDMAELLEGLEGQEVDIEEMVARLADEDVDVKVITKRFADAEVDFDALEQRQTKRQIEIIKRDQELTEAEIDVIIKDMREGLEDAREATEEARVQLRAYVQSKEWEEDAKKARSRTFVTLSCDNSSGDVATSVEREDGRTEVMICQKRAMDEALKGRKQARAASAQNSAMSERMRKQVLEELDQQIDSWRKDAR